MELTVTWRADPEAAGSPRASLRPLTLYTMLAVVYCAGLPISEIAHLNLGKVDLTAGTIAIRETKFFKSRILPLAASVVAALGEYLEARRRAEAPQDPASELFRHDKNGTRYSTQTIMWLFVDILLGESVANVRRAAN